jgi:hypothetical protein
VTDGFDDVCIMKSFNMEWHDWMDSTIYHNAMAKRLDLNIGVWMGDEK